jgi:hypothetical protein
MSRKCIKLFVTLFFFPVICWSQIGTLQDESDFLRHLRIQKLYRERIFVLHHLSTQSPETDIEKGWTYHVSGKLDSALFYYNQVPPDSIAAGGFHANYLSLLFKSNALAKLQMEQRHPMFRTDEVAIKKIDLAMDLMQLKYSSNEKLPDEIAINYKKYRTIEKKSAFLAGTYSICIPGLGKLYYGQKHQAWNMFFANAALGLQAYESYHKAGIRSPRFIIFGGLFSIFYLSNIYGTITGLKKTKRDHKLQLHHEIIDYYFSDADVYPGKY